MLNQVRGQVWIETVVYTLIAFIMIGSVLAFVKPEIEKIQDKAVIDQSSEMLNDINNIILDIGVPGNQRLIEVGLKKGNLKIDGAGDKLIFEIESLYEYSEPGENVSKVDGGIVAFTESQGKYNLITLTRDYGEAYNLTFDGQDSLKTITKSSTAYKLLISNEGEIANKITINMEVN
ncbi:hypothetical protein GOV13_05330 [Candidatus Pacearchaeota archaeon]|nr:hypothetical protein [Candidatus Pacearchaeota archaeon]